jgi:GAF domain-containing protein
MAEELTLSKSTNKEVRYQSLIPQIKALIADEPDETANLANIAAALKQEFGFFWVGFYRVIGNELVLGPFQGPIACTRIAFGKGVCGSAWKENKTLIGPDVDQFPGHIACSSNAQSDIVVPCSKTRKVTLILDVDSDTYDSIDEIDERYLKEIFSGNELKKSLDSRKEKSHSSLS